MRRFLLVLMIALLPLRGWVGDVMAMEMLVQHPAAMQNVAASADAKMHEECHAEAEPSSSAADSGQSHCGSCPLCLICHSMAAPAPWAASPAVWLIHALPATDPTRFASAASAFALKPPIS